MACSSNLVPDILTSTQFVPEGNAVATDWVKFVRKEAGLKQAFMFGTHDSARGVGKGIHFNIEEQLKNGSRFFDFQLAAFEGDIWVYHDKAIIPFEQAMSEIEAFLASNQKEKVIIHLSQSENAPIKWGDVKRFLRRGTHNKLVHKLHAEKPFSLMKGSIILIAPKGLEMDGNWGEDAIAKFQTQKDLSTTEGLSKFLEEDSPSKGEGRPVWVQCRSLENEETRRVKEIEAVKKYFGDSCGKYNINIVTFQSVDDTHFPGLKETLI